MSKYRLKTDGDKPEMDYCNDILDSFPEYELLWRNFIVPWTNRDILLRSDPNWLQFRSTIPKFMEELCMTHYSVFRDLAFFLKEIKRHNNESLRTIYTHFGHAIEMAHLLSVKILIAKKEVGLIKEDIFCGKKENILIEEFKKFIRKDYKNKLKDYQTKQIPIMYLVQGTRKFLKKIVSKKEDLDVLERYFRSVQDYRNKFIHSPLPGTLFNVNSKLQISIPMAIRKDKMHKYELWTDIKRAIQDDRHKNDFIPERSFLDKEFNGLKQKLNLLWIYYINELRKIYKTDILKYSLAYTKWELKMIKEKEKIEGRIVK